MKTNELKKGNFYSDKDGVDVVLYKRQYNNCLWEFEGTEYDDVACEYRPNGDKRLLTSSEVQKLIEA